MAESVRPYYEADGITIYHGDSLELLPSIAAGSVHMVCTDPPYVIGAVSSGALGSKSGGWQDMMNSASWFTSWYREVDRILKGAGSFWSFLNWRTLPVVMRAATDAGMPLTSLAVWDKEWIGPGGSQGLRPSYELVALLCKPEFWWTHGRPVHGQRHGGAGSPGPGPAPHRANLTGRGAATSAPSASRRSAPGVGRMAVTRARTADRQAAPNLLWTGRNRAAPKPNLGGTR